MTGKTFPLAQHVQSHILVLLMATARPLPWTESFKSEGGCGLFLFGGFGFFDVCVNCA